MLKKKKNIAPNSVTLDAPGIKSVALFPDAEIDNQINIDTQSISVVPLVDQIPFPSSPIAIKVDDESLMPMLEKAFADGESVLAIAKNPESKADSRRINDYAHVGTVCKVAKIIKFPGVPTGVFFLPGPRASLEKFINRRKPLKAQISILSIYSDSENPSDKEIKLQLLEEVKIAYDNFLSFLPDEEKDKITCSFPNDDPYDWFAIGAFIADNSPLNVMEKADILGASDSLKFLEKLLTYLNLAIKKFEIKAQLLERTRIEITENQKKMFLQQQIRTIQEELGSHSGPPDENDDFEELTKRSLKKTWNAATQSLFDKELSKLMRFNPNSPEYSIQYAYLDTLLNLPWLDYSPSDFKISEVEERLNQDHYGLEKVKERILEHMAVLNLRNDLKSPIICLSGPPGVGKTSLGASIAKAIGREYARISLGGVHDEAEIRGHRRTYIGAMPGRIIHALAKCGKGNPVVVLDEIDKINTGLKGDPSTALLEVLDPEQNSHFHDNYLNCDYDLSDVLFIATANSLSSISRPLLDRMEIIDVSGYIPEEKVEIALRHLIPKNLSSHGFKKDEICFSDAALREIIDRYTRESGVRSLEKKIAKILRQLALLKASDKDFPHQISPEDVRRLLGKSEVVHDLYEDNSFPGVVTGLAWTEVGGEILFIETSLSEGNGDKLSLTGNLGDVMKESAAIALQYLRANPDLASIDHNLFAKRNVHIHVPEGAVPKDGPSAGIAILTSLASAFSGRLVKPKLAMTGEMTLRGKVLPVGGIREKILAAKRAGITDIILSECNKADIEEIPPKYLEGLTFHHVSTAAEVLELSLI